MTPSGAVTVYSGDDTVNTPTGITVGSDGALWFTKFGRQFDRAHHDFWRDHILFGVWIGHRSGSPPVQTVVVVHNINGNIGRITTSGAISIYSGSSLDDPYGITSGPNGALWFTNKKRRDYRADHDIGNRFRIPQSRHRHRFHNDRL